jgi:hypothetical protein
VKIVLLVAQLEETESEWKKPNQNKRSRIRMEETESEWCARGAARCTYAYTMYKCMCVYIYMKINMYVAIFHVHIYTCQHMCVNMYA